MSLKKILLLLLVNTALLTAATYYLSPGGSDGNPGTFALPWESLVWAFEDSGVISDGDNVIFKEAGNYGSESEDIDIENSDILITIHSSLSYGDVQLNMGGNRLDLNFSRVTISNIIFDNIDEIRIDGGDNHYIFSNEFNVASSGLPIYIRSGSGTGHTIMYNRFLGNMSYGIRFDNGDHTVISNYFDGADTVFDVNSGSQLIADNVILNCSDRAFDMDGGNCYITNNHMAGVPEPFNIGSGSHYIIDNIITNGTGAQDAIEFGSGSQIIMGNIIDGYDRGIYLNGGNNSVVKSNLIYNIVQEGIRNIDSGGIISYNTMHHCDRGFHSSGGNNNMVYSNTACSNVHSGFYMYSSSDADSTLKNNLAFSNGKWGFGYNAGQDLRYVGNTAYNNGLAGFYAKASGSGSDMAIFLYNSAVSNVNGFLCSESSFTTMIFSNNLAAYNREAAITGSLGSFTAYNSVVFGPYSNALVTLDASCSTADPVLWSRGSDMHNLTGNWNSSATNLATANPVSAACGRHTLQVKVTNTNAGEYSRYILTFYNESEITIPNNAIIELFFTREGGGMTFFDLNSITSVSSTSSWGGGSPTFNWSASVHNLTINRTGGNNSGVRESENLIIDNVKNSAVGETNFYISMNIRSNTGEPIGVNPFHSHHFRLFGEVPIPPVTDFTNPAPGVIITNSSFVFAGYASNFGSESAGVFFSANGSGFALASGLDYWFTNVNLSAFNETSNTFYIIASNTNVSNNVTTNSQINYIDFTPPVLAVTNPGSGLTVSDTVNFSGSNHDGSTISGFWWKTNSSAWINEPVSTFWNIPIDTTAVINGQFIFTVKSSNAVGLVTTAAVTNYITNLSGVSIAETNTAQMDIISGSHIFKGRADNQDIGSDMHIFVSINSGPDQLIATNLTTWSTNFDTAGLSDGTNIWRFTGSNTMGAVTVFNQTNIIDNSAPLITLISPTNRETVEDSYQISGTVNENFSSITATVIHISNQSGVFDITAADPQTFNETWNTATVNDGSNYIFISATNNLGLFTVSPTVSFYVNNSRPVIQLQNILYTNLLNSTPFSCSNIYFRGIATNQNPALGAPTVSLIVNSSNYDQTTATNFDLSLNTAPLNDSSYDFIIFAEGGNGHNSAVTNTITVDNTAPVIAAVQPDSDSSDTNDSLIYEDYTFSFSVTEDSGSLLGSVCYITNSGGITNQSFTFSSTGSQNFSVNTFNLSNSTYGLIIRSSNVCGFTSVTNLDFTVFNIAGSLDNLIIGPNPFDRTEMLKVLLQNVTRTTTVRIYSVNGKIIRNLDYEQDGYCADGVGCIDWDLQDQRQNPVAGGIYIIAAADEKSSKVLKLTVSR